MSFRMLVAVACCLASAAFAGSSTAAPPTPDFGPSVKIFDPSMSTSRYMDALLGRLRTAGFPADTTYHAYHVLDGRILGFSLWESSHSYTPAQVSELTAMFARTISEYAHLHEHGQQHITEGPHREVSALAFGLDLILDGLRKIHALSA